MSALKRFLLRHDLTRRLHCEPFSKELASNKRLIEQCRQNLISMEFRYQSLKHRNCNDMIKQKQVQYERDTQEWLLGNLQNKIITQTSCHVELKEKIENIALILHNFKENYYLDQRGAIYKTIPAFSMIEGPLLTEDASFHFPVTVNQYQKVYGNVEHLKKLRLIMYRYKKSYHNFKKKSCVTEYYDF